MSKDLAVCINFLRSAKPAEVAEAERRGMFSDQVFAQARRVVANEKLRKRVVTHG